MDKEKNAIDRFLGEFGNEETPKDPFEDEQAQDPFEEPEEIPVEKEEVKEKPLKFNEDPKVQRYLKKEIDKALSQFQSTRQETVTKVENEDTTSVVEAFTAIIGNDTPEKIAALKSLERALGNVDQRASQKAIERLEELQKKSSEEDRAAEEELQEGFESVEDHYDITFTPARRKAFAAYCERIAPKDQYGEVKDYPDFINAYEDFLDKEKRSQAPDRSKQLAARGMARSTSTQTETPQSRPTWDEADAFIESLK